MREHKYFVYIVCSNSGTLYIGMTNDIYRRALQHKRGEIEGFAAKYGCNRLVYYESFDDVGKAIDREKQLKRWVRRKKIALIESCNPRWADLAEKWGAEMAFPGQSLRKQLKDISHHPSPLLPAILSETARFALAIHSCSAMLPPLDFAIHLLPVSLPLPHLQRAAAPLRWGYR